LIIDKSLWKLKEPDPDVILFKYKYTKYIFILFTSTAIWDKTTMKNKEMGTINIILRIRFPGLVVGRVTGLSTSPQRALCSNFSSW
jgi:hypothetical protein